MTIAQTLVADYKQIVEMTRNCPIRPQPLRDAIALAKFARVQADAGNISKARHALDIALERVGLERASD